MSKNYKKIYIRIFIAIISIFIVFFLTWTLTWTSDVQVAKSSVPYSYNLESVTVLAGNTIARLSVAPDTIFYDALTQAKNQGQISFDGKNYPGLGFFITDIGSLHSGNGKNLLYYINGKEATVGVSSYTLKDGDVIEWKLK